MVLVFVWFWQVLASFGFSPGRKRAYILMLLVLFYQLLYLKLEQVSGKIMLCWSLVRIRYQNFHRVSKYGLS